MKQFFEAVLNAVVPASFFRSFFCRAFPGANGCGGKGINPAVKRMFRR